MNSEYFSHKEINEVIDEIILYENSQIATIIMELLINLNVWI